MSSKGGASETAAALVRKKRQRQIFLTRTKCDCEVARETAKRLAESLKKSPGGRKRAGSTSSSPRVGVRAMSSVGPKAPRRRLQLPARAPRSSSRKSSTEHKTTPKERSEEKSEEEASEPELQAWSQGEEDDVPAAFPSPVSFKASPTRPTSLPAENRARSESAELDVEGESAKPSLNALYLLSAVAAERQSPGSPISSGDVQSSPKTPDCPGSPLASDPSNASTPKATEEDMTNADREVEEVLSSPSGQGAQLGLVLGVSPLPSSINDDACLQDSDFGCHDIISCSHDDNLGRPRSTDVDNPVDLFSTVPLPDAPRSSTPLPQEPVEERNRSEESSKDCVLSGGSRDEVQRGLSSASDSKTSVAPSSLSAENQTLGSDGQTLIWTR